MIRSVQQNFFGVIINENVTWSDHINVILNKTNKNLGVIHRLAKSLPKEVLQTLYITLIEQYLQGCITNVLYYIDLTVFTSS